MVGCFLEALTGQLVVAQSFGLLSICSLSLSSTVGCSKVQWISGRSMKFPWGWKALCELRSQCSRWLSVCQSNTCQSWGGEGGWNVANNCFLFSQISPCNVWLHVLTLLFKMKSRMASSLLPEHLKLTFGSNLYWRRCAPHDSGWIANHDDPI